MRLIDADRLAETIDHIILDPKNILGFYRDVLNAIGTQPTAYDVDKVVEELESLNPVDYGSIYSYEGHSCAREMKRDAIDIVIRGGGVNVT